MARNTKKITDEFSDLKVSRQRKWQLRREKAGLCRICGQPAVQILRGAKVRCLTHAIAQRELFRARAGSKRRINSASYRAQKALNHQPLINTAPSGR